MATAAAACDSGEVWPLPPPHSTFPSCSLDDLPPPPFRFAPRRLHLSPATPALARVSGAVVGSDAGASGCYSARPSACSLELCKHKFPQGSFSVPEAAALLWVTRCLRCPQEAAAPDAQPIDEQLPGERPFPNDKKMELLIKRAGCADRRSKKFSGPGSRAEVGCHGNSSMLITPSEKVIGWAGHADRSTHQNQQHTAAGCDLTLTIGRLEEEAMAMSSEANGSSTTTEEAVRSAFRMFG